MNSLCMSCSPICLFAIVFPSKQSGWFTIYLNRKKSEFVVSELIGSGEQNEIIYKGVAVFPSR